MNKKMILLDVDGTITARQGMPESAGKAIRAAKEAGNIPVFFTGRPYRHIDAEVRDLPFDGAICTMGAWISAEGKILLDKSIPGECKDAIVAATRKYHLDATFEYADGIAFDNTKPLMPLHAKLKEIFGSKGLETAADIDSPDFRFEKVCVWANDQSDLPAFDREVTQYVTCTGSKGTMAEYSAKGSSPAEAVRLLMDTFGITKKDTYAIGDSINDMPFLSCAGTTGAMGEANDEMKAQVTYVTDGLYEDGLAHFLEHFGLTE